MKAHLTRAVYDEHILLGVPAEGAEFYDSIRAKLYAQRYPASTAEAIHELKSRGFAVDANAIHYLLRTGQIPGPAGDSRNLKWGPEEIDAAAEALAGLGDYFNASAVRRDLEGVDAAQELEAEAAALREWPGTPRGELVRTVIPGGIAVPARVSFRPMTAAEAAGRSAAIQAARSRRY